MFLGDHAQAPSCRAQDITWRAALSVLALSAAGLLASPAQALDLTFGSALRIDSEDNPDLDDSTDDGLTWAELRLNLDGLMDVGAAQLAFGAAGQLQGDLFGPGSGKNTRFANPLLYLDYARQSANASFTFSARLQEADLTQNQAIDDFDENVGTRRTRTLSTGFSVGDSSSLGFSATLTHDDVTYRDDPNGTQVDYQRTRLDTQTRMDLNEVTQLTVGLGWSQYEDEDGSNNDTLTADLGLNIARPFGVASASLSYSETDGNEDISLSVGHTFEMPRGTQSFRIGVGRAPDGGLTAVGSLGLQLATPNGGWTGSFDRGFASDATTDTEEVFTQLGLSYAHALTPVDGLSFDVAYVERETLSTGETTTRAEIGARYNRQLNNDWSLSMGVRHRARWRSADTDDSTNSAFIELRHTLSAQY